MSASEKLKALDAALTESPWFYEAGVPEGGDRTGSVWAKTPTLELVMAKPHVIEAQRLLALRNALPQIVAVIEAAERAIYVYDRTEATGSTLVGSSEVLGPLSLEKLQEIRRDALDALVALEEALS